MNLPVYDIRDFIRKIKDKDRSEMISLTEKELAWVETRFARARGSDHYIDTMKGLLSFLKTGTRLAGVSDSDFRSFQPVIESLVQQKHLQPDTLKLFEKER